MFGKLLTLLAWTGLWQPQMVVLNGNTPAPRQHLNASEMAHTTSRFMAAVVEHFVSSDGQKVSYATLEQSPFYTRSFQEFGGLLQNTDPRHLDDQERRAFFINLYNILTIHAILYSDPLPTSTISVPNFWKRYSYKVGPFTLHLDDMEHGILRGNRAHPTSGKVMFGHQDPRTALSLTPDRRIHGALNCGAMSCPPLRSYSSDNIDGELSTAIAEFCNKSVTTNTDGSLVINQIFQWFRVDFGATEPDALRWLAECVEDVSTQQALRQAALGTRGFSYHYDWTLNAVSGAGGGKVKVEVYFSSLCTDSMRFFTHQLYPAWQQLQDIIDLELIPYGKARATPTSDGNYSFVCQHGPDECHGNKVMTCAAASLPINTQVQLLHCMMGKRYPAYTGQQCSAEVGIEWAPLRDCASSREGAALLYQNGIKTASLKPRVYFIPTITIDGHYDSVQLRSSLLDLKSQVCAVYQGPPHQECL